MSFPTKRKCVVIIGEDLSVKGGITSVLRAYLNSNLASEFELRHIPTLIEGSSFQKLLIFLQALAIFNWTFLTQKVQLVHIHSSSYASFFRKSVFVLLAKLWRRPVLFHIHGSRFHTFYQQALLPIKMWIRLTLNLVDRIIVLSESWRNRIAQMGTHSAITVLKNPVECANLEPNPNPHSNGQFTILFLGELSKRKGIFDLLDIAAELLRNVPTVKFILAGNGNLSQIQQIIEAEGLEDYFLLPGWISSAERQCYFHQADLFILPSYDEGLPVAILEAMACGLPVVSTTAGGIPELVENGVNGILVPPGDKTALKQAIISMIQNDPLRRQVGEKNRAKIQGEYDIQVIAAVVKQLYYQTMR